MTKRILHIHSFMKVLAASAAILGAVFFGAGMTEAHASTATQSSYMALSPRLVTGPGALGSISSPRTDNRDIEQKFEGGEVRFLRASFNEDGTESQQLSSVIRSSDGKVIVVDGGVADDSEHLLGVIKEFGGYVDAWLITHPQGDHVGALIDILTNHQGEIDIRGIYGRLFDLSWYAEADSGESGVPWLLMEQLEKVPADRLHLDIKKGDQIVLSDKLSFRVMNDPLDVRDEYTVNNSSIMYDVCLEGKHIIYLGDMGPAAGDQHMQSGVLDGITADLVQMSHHGQNGVTREFYEKLAPKACVWPAPDWLYNARPENKGLVTWITKQWIEEMGINENYCTKDGDVIIK